jgi:hypothetical protein
MMKKLSSLFVLLGVFMLLVVATAPSASAQEFRLAWHNSKTGVTQHDAQWTDDIACLVGRELAMNFQVRNTSAWIERKRRLFGFIPLRSERIEPKPSKFSGRLRSSLPAPYL